MNNKITVGELKKMVMESQDQFKPKVGDGVESENKKNNNKSYKDAETRSGAKEVKTKHNLDKKEDGNKTTLDYAIEADCGKNFRDKVKAQAEGYTSTLEKENGIEKIGDFSDDTYKQFKKAGEEMAKNKVEAKKAGLTARELPKSAFEKE